MEKASGGELSPRLGWGLAIALGAIGTLDTLLNIAHGWHKFGRAQKTTALALVLGRGDLLGGGRHLRSLVSGKLHF